VLRGASILAEQTNPTGQFACLTYHRVGDAPGQYTISHARLGSQLTFLEKEGYTVEGFQGLQDRLSLAQDLPARYAVFTVDDGHISSMRAGDSLQGHGFSATFFVTRDRCLRNADFMRPPQLRELRRRGFSLGTHGTSHRKLTRISEQECRQELTESRFWLEDVLGESVPFTAVPGGFVNALVMRIALEQEYSMIATCRECMNVLPRPSKLLQPINRVNMRSHFSHLDLRRIVEGNPWFYFRRQLRSAAIWLPKQLLAARLLPEPRGQPMTKSYWTTAVRELGGFGAADTAPPRSNIGVISIVTDEPAELVFPPKSEYCVYPVGTE
jgi:Predicted xylanase/chitin deacetylase